MFGTFADPARISLNVRTVLDHSSPRSHPKLFQTHGELLNWPAYYTPPTTAPPVVRQAKDGGGRELVLMQWGLIPWFSKDGKPSYSTINARAEGVQTAASFREPFSKGRRCIVPASGYFDDPLA